MVTRAEEAEQTGQWVQRTDLPASQATQDLTQGIDGLDGLIARGDVRTIERTGRRANDQIWRDPALIKGAQHADLDRSEAGATGENEADRRGFAHAYWRPRNRVSYPTRSAGKTARRRDANPP